MKNDEIILGNDVNRIGNDEFISPSFPRRREYPELSDEIDEIIEENDDLIVWLHNTEQEIPAYAGMTVKVKGMIVNVKRMTVKVKGMIKKK